MTNPRDLARRMAEKSDRELLAMFASPEGWTAEALDIAKRELRKRGLDIPGDRPSPGPEHPGRSNDDRPDVYEYEYIGTYPNGDVRLLLDAFVREGIGFTLNADMMGLAEMPAFQAAYGGTFGTGVGIAIGVHTDDCDRAMDIRQRVLKIVT